MWPDLGVASSNVFENEEVQGGGGDKSQNLQNQLVSALLKEINMAKLSHHGWVGGSSVCGGIYGQVTDPL